MIGRHFFHSTAYLWKLYLNVTSYALSIFLSIATKLGLCADTHSFPVTDVLRYSQLKPSVDNHLHMYVYQMFLFSLVISDHY